MTTLRVLGWEHPRCILPLRASAERWRELRPNVRVGLTARPLASFNDQPLSDLIDAFDIVMVDHPFIGVAERQGLLVPLDTVLDRALLRELETESIGPSHSSYTRNGHQWAIGIDAACHVSASRPDRLPDPPRDWSGVLELARRSAGRVAWPLYPTDCICSFLTLYVSAGGALTEQSAIFDRQPAGEVLDYLSEILPHLHRETLGLNPPAVLDRMANTDEIDFVPLTFGYRALAYPSDGSAPLAFAAPPAHRSGRPTPIVGGAGIALSATTRNLSEAAAYVAWLAEPRQQVEIIATAGGQPGARRAWQGGGDRFFSATRPALEVAWVRPRAPWWPVLQERAGELLRAGLDRRDRSGDLWQALNDLLSTCRADASPAASASTSG